MDRPVRLKEAVFLFAVWLVFRSIFVVADDLTITTYYPSPYGVYNQLRTRDDTYLATAAAGTANVGTPPASDQAKFYVDGGATDPAVMIETDNAATIGLVVRNQSAPADSTGIQLYQQNDGVAVISNDIGSNGAYIKLQNTSRAIDIGADANGQRHNLSINGNLVITPPACTPTNIPFGAGVTALCGAGQYVTWFPGVYIKGRMDQPSPYLRDVPNDQDYNAFTLTANPNGGEPPAAGTYSFASGAGNAFCCPITP